MKPPWRPRVAPSRFADAPQSPERPQRGPWGLREKRALLVELRARAQRGLSEQRLLAELRERLPRRSEEEIRALLRRLRGRAAREALTSKFRNLLHFQRQPRAPIQMWQDLAQTLQGALEGPPSAAFSQVLMVAAMEPLTRNHSRPPQNSGFLGTPPNLGTPPVGSEPPPNSGPPQTPGGAGDGGGFGADLGKIYEFLGALSAGGRGPP